MDTATLPPITLWLTPLNAGGPDRRFMLDGYAAYIRETDCSTEEHMQAHIIERLLDATPERVKVNDLWISYFTAWLRPYPDADIGAAAQQLQPIFLRAWRQVYLLTTFPEVSSRQRELPPTGPQ